MHIQKVVNKIWKIGNGYDLSSNVYLVDIHEPILIDLGNILNAKNLIKALESIRYKKEKIKKVIFTHLHFDHTGKPSDFKNAEFYASKEAIDDLNKNPFLTTLNESSAKELKKIKLKPIKTLKGFKIIKTPGHTKGSICLLEEKNKILFSGDIIFNKGIGRIDLPTSTPKKLRDTLNRLKKLKYKILCPGH